MTCKGVQNSPITEEILKIEILTATYAVRLICNLENQQMNAKNAYNSKNIKDIHQHTKKIGGNSPSNMQS